jgi:orotidine-5'-phosphate decarboxylase
MTKEQLVLEIKNKNSFLCIGLDSDINKLPPHLPATANGVLQFNKAIIDATRNYCVSYKPNTAFYEAMGAAGWQCLQDTIAYIGANHFIIADAKRGDIGNTAAQYAKAFFETMPCDAVTIAPYMGQESVLPFFEYPNKMAVLLALTSNKSASDFQLTTNDNGQKLYEKVLQEAAQWGSPTNTMFVVGATQAAELLNIRTLVPNHFLLVPGVGTQGGSLTDVFLNGHNKEVGLLINVSRDIIFAGQGLDFTQQAALKAQHYQGQMASLLHHFNWI